MPQSLETLAERGPYAVGVTNLSVLNPARGEMPLPTEIWYPATHQPEDAVRAQHPLARPHDAYEDLAPLDEACPVVLFSHGNSGLRQQSTFLTSHLASWGFVVAAPDHIGNTFLDMLKVKTQDDRIAVHKVARAHRPGDMIAVLERLIEGGNAWPACDPGRVGSLGHSFGGWTAIKTASLDARVRAVCGLAAVSEPFVGKKAFAPGELPLPATTSTLLAAGLDDVLVDIDTSVRPLFERLGAGAGLVTIADCDHFHFCDGIDLLHQMHENNPRPNATRATRPRAELLGETRMHRMVRGLVTGFFDLALAEPTEAEASTPSADRSFDQRFHAVASREALAGFDSALSRVPT